MKRAVLWVGAILLLSGMALTTWWIRSKPTIDSLYDTPPIVGPGEIGRFVLASGSFEDERGGKTVMMIRLDTRTGSAWRLAMTPVLDASVDPTIRDVKERMQVMQDEKGNPVLMPAWESISEAGALFGHDDLQRKLDAARKR